MLKKTQQLCDELQSSYDAKIIYKYPKQLQTIVKIISSNNIKNKNKNNNLIKLINNLDKKPSPIVQYISGPHTCQKYISKKYNKTIYLFAEQHSKLGQCQHPYTQHFHTYLQQLFQNTTTFIDFYIEIPIFTDIQWKQTLSPENTLYDISQNFSKNCLGTKKNITCPWPVRIHSIDVRRLWSTKYKIFDFAIFGIALRQNVPLLNIQNQFRNLINQLSQLNTKQKMYSFIWYNIQTNPIIKKEMDKSILTTKQFYSAFNLILNHNINTFNYNLDFNIICKWIKKLKNAYKDFPNGKSFVTQVFIYLGAVIVDIYALARMFKVFNTLKNKNQPKEPKNIIYYAGDGHTIPLGIVLNLFGFKIVEKSKHTNLPSCTDMINIKQPLFT
jgi:hypothetical protein